MARLANHARRSIMHPWTSQAPTTTATQAYALVDIDPGDRYDVRAGGRPGRPVPRRTRPPRRHRPSRRRPASAACRSAIPVRAGLHVPTRRAGTDRRSRAVSGAAAAEPRELGAGRVQAVGAAWRGLTAHRSAVNRQTLVAPYAVRPVANAGSVSAPLLWDELDDPDLRPGRWDIRHGLSTRHQRSAATCSRRRSRLSVDARVGPELGGLARLVTHKPEDMRLIYTP